MIEVHLHKESTSFAYSPDFQKSVWKTSRLVFLEIVALFEQPTKVYIFGNISTLCARLSQNSVSGERASEID